MAVAFFIKISKYSTRFQYSQGHVQMNFDRTENIFTVIRSAVIIWNWLTDYQNHGKRKEEPRSQNFYKARHCDYAAAGNGPQWGGRIETMVLPGVTFLSGGVAIDNLIALVNPFLLDPICLYWTCLWEWEDGHWFSWHLINHWVLLKDD